MSDRDAVERLNSAKYLYLRELYEPGSNSLKLVVEEAVANKFGVLPAKLRELPELQHIFARARPIESIEGCCRFELYWKRYIAYLVTEESIGSTAKHGYSDESYSGTTLRRYSKSHFLDHIRKDTGSYVSKVQHFKLICLNHLIDIAAYTAPEVQIIDAHSEPPIRPQ